MASPNNRWRRLWARVKRSLSTFGGIWGAPSTSGYAGGRLNRLTADWVMLPLSADQELKWNLRAVRARARELVRDNPFAKRFIQLCATNLIGPKGIRLQGAIRTQTGEMHAPTNTQLETEWALWGRAGTCTADGRWSFREVERLIAKSLPQDGEVLIRLVRYWKGNDWAFAIQLLDPDQLDVLYNAPAGKNGVSIRMGVEVDEWQRPLAYHVFSSHPAEYEYDSARERLRIPAEEMIHLYLPHRIAQTRGISWFHPVMISLKMFDGYQEAELVAARTAAAKMWFIKTQGETYVPPADTEKVQMQVEPGLIEELDPGKDIATIDPQHPTQAFEPFSKMILKSVATGLSVTHANLSGDLAEANYSSLRAGLLPERDEWRGLQDFLIEHCHRRIYETWLDMAILAGRVKLGMRDPESLKLVRWEPRGWEWVDPKNEMDAAALAIANGLNSRQAIAAERGRDVEEVFDELAEEQKLAESYGINVTPTLRPTETTTAPPEGEPAASVSQAKSLRVIGRA